MRTKRMRKIASVPVSWYPKRETDTSNRPNLWREGEKVIARLSVSRISVKRSNEEEREGNSTVNCRTTFVRKGENISRVNTVVERERSSERRRTRAPEMVAIPPK